MKKYQPIGMDEIKTLSIQKRKSKVHVAEHFAQPIKGGGSFGEFLNCLPNLLGVESLHRVVDAIIDARKRKKPVVMALGGHVIKCGLQPILKTLIENEIVTAIAMNGSAAVHDFEISLIGATSEDVSENIQNGMFGFSEETGKGINEALRLASKGEKGFGEVIGRWILDQNHPYREYSLIAAAVSRGIPVTVHVAIGTDIVHQHPAMDGAITGEMSFRDFRLITSVVADLGQGGVWLNVGSAVVMPEVFLKALSVARNLGHKIDDFTTADFDMIRQYRTMNNVVSRPTLGSGKGHSIIGHHEINIPLLAAAILERFNS